MLSCPATVLADGARVLYFEQVVALSLSSRFLRKLPLDVDVKAVARMSFEIDAVRRFAGFMPRVDSIVLPYTDR